MIKSDLSISLKVFATIRRFSQMPPHAISESRCSSVNCGLGIFAVSGKAVRDGVCFVAQPAVDTVFV